MLRELFQYVVGMRETHIKEIDGRKFHTNDLTAINETLASSIKVNSLDGMVDYLKSNFDGERKLIVHVESPTSVSCFDALNRDKNRSDYIVANAFTPNFRFGNWYDREEFTIALQSSFVNDLATDRAPVLKLVGNVTEDEAKTYVDDGISQSVTAKAGVANVEVVDVPNPVTLAPFRTFVEVDQPSSEFVFRLRKGPSCALFEADGGAWKLEAMDNISVYLNRALEQEIEKGLIIIIS